MKSQDEAAYIYVGYMQINHQTESVQEISDISILYVGKQQVTWGPMGTPFRMPNIIIMSEQYNRKK